MEVYLIYGGIINSNKKKILKTLQLQKHAVIINRSLIIRIILTKHNNNNLKISFLMMGKAELFIN